MRFRGQGDTVDPTILQYITVGDCSIEGSRQRRENGGNCVPIVVFIDELRVFVATTASFIKISVEKGTVSHDQ